MAENTVLDAIILCGVDNAVRFNGSTAAERIATEIFDDDFASCMDKSVNDLESDLKAYSSLTVANGQIRLLPATKKNLRAFIQWARDTTRVGDDPTLAPFPVHDAPNLLRRYKSHEAFIAKSKTITETAKPELFTDKVKWEDWSPVFINFLRAIPGRDGVPLSYICRPNENPVVDPNADFIDDYVNRAPLEGEAFRIDASEVHTYITNFTSGNSTAESKLLANSNCNNGRLDFIALKEHYEGVGINAVEIIKADKTLDTLFYSAEKKPHMWWDKFERLLTRAFQIYDKKEGREVSSEEMKLRKLCSKINADFLQGIRTTLEIELTQEPMTMTYSRALTNF